MKSTVFTICAVLLLATAVTGCRTQTAYINPETAQVVSAFSEKDVRIAIGTAVKAIISLNRIVPPAGSTRAIMIVEDIVNDTASRGRHAGALSEALGLSLRQQLTDSGKILVYNREMAEYATVKVTPQYILKGRLTEQNHWQDDSDAQKEYNLNLQLIDLATGLEFWQRRIPIIKIVDEKNVIY